MPTETLTSKITSKLKTISKLINYLLFLFTIIFITFIFSEPYRVNKCIKQMDIYRHYLVINPILKDDTIKEKK